jgi:hypothetical protein
VPRLSRGQSFFIALAVAVAASTVLLATNLLASAVISPAALAASQAQARADLREESSLRELTETYFGRNWLFSRQMNSINSPSTMSC